MATSKELAGKIECENLDLKNLFEQASKNRDSTVETVIKAAKEWQQFALPHIRNRYAAKINTLEADALKQLRTLLNEAAENMHETVASFLTAEDVWITETNATLKPALPSRSEHYYSPTAVNRAIRKVFAVYGKILQSYGLASAADDDLWVYEGRDLLPRSVPEWDSPTIHQLKKQLLQYSTICQNITRQLQTIATTKQQYEAALANEKWNSAL